MVNSKPASPSPAPAPTKSPKSPKSDSPTKSLISKTNAKPTPVKSAGQKSDKKLAQVTGPAVSVARPDAVVMRMRGVLTSGHFDQEVDKFAKEHVLQYLSEHRDEKTTGMLLQRLREDALLDRDSGDFGRDVVPQVPAAPAPLEQQLAAAVMYMQWSVTREPEQHPFSPITLLKDSICKEGMAAGQLKTPVFEDAVRAMTGWRFGQYFIKNYTLDVPDSEDQERLLTHTTSGDIRKCIANFIRLGQAEKALLPRTYRTIVAMIRTEPANILFLTDSRAEAAAAMQQKLTVILVRRPGESVDRPGESAGAAAVPTVSSFDEIHFIHDPSRPAACC